MLGSFRYLKEGEVSDLGNYHPISILCCFSKILEKIMYNHLYKHLLHNYILYKKQFEFQEYHSTSHAIIQLVDQIYGIVKAFDTRDLD